MRPLAVAAAVAFALVLAYALWLQPTWEPASSDQLSYLALARGLVERGEYTRAPLGDAFAPEPLRPPGYPLFLAPLCLGGCDHWRIAVAQAGLYAVLVLLAYELAVAVLPRRAAIVATFLVACYLPIAYYAALALSDFLAVFLMVAGLTAFVRARRTASMAWAVAAGALLGWLGLTRAVYVLFPAMLALTALVTDRAAVFTRRALRPLIALALAFALVLAPLFIYSATYLGRPFASSSGSAVWLGAVQGLTEADIDDFERGELAAVRADVAAFDLVADRVAQADAWVHLNEQLGLHGQRIIAHDPAGYLARTPLRAAILWAGDLPVPSEVATSLPAGARPLFAFVPMALFLFGFIGALALARRRVDAALLPLAVIIYVSAVAIPLGTEARYALAAKPLLIVAAVAGFSALWPRRSRDAPP